MDSSICWKCCKMDHPYQRIFCFRRPLQVYWVKKMFPSCQKQPPANEFLSVHAALVRYKHQNHRMIGVGRDITGLPVNLHSHILKSILSTSNENFFQLAINRANDAGWQIWREKQQRVSIVGMMLFRTLNICCSCILFSQIMPYCQP